MSDADRRDDTRRTFIGSVVCIDLVGYSKRSVAQQRSVKVEFDRILTHTLQFVPEQDRIILDTGDGASITFLGDPEECLTLALRIRDAMNASSTALGGDDDGPIRIGINFGAIKFTRDLNGRRNVVGDSVSGAARIVSHARPGQVVISHSFRAMVSRLSDGDVALVGQERVVAGHGESDDIYSVADAFAPRTGGAHPGARTLRINRRAQRAIAVALLMVLVLVTGAWLLLRMVERAPQTTAAAPGAEAPVVPPAPAPSLPAVTQELQVEPQKTPGKMVAERAPGPKSSPRPKEPESQAPAAVPSPAPAEVSSTTAVAKDLTRPVSRATRDSSRATPISREQPRFPVSAANEGLQRGSVHARLEIDAAGNVTEVHILSADPPRIFNRESIRALGNWRFDSGDPGRTYDVTLEFQR